MESLPPRQVSTTRIKTVDEAEPKEVGEHTQRHTQTNVRILHHFRKLLKADLPIAILIGLHDRLVDDLLQLHILQVVADHHLQDDEELAVGDVSVAVDVVHLECKPKLLLLVALGAEGRQPGNEFLEVDVAATVLVEDGDHSFFRWKLESVMDLWGG